MSHPYSILLLCIALVNLALAIYALRFIRSPGALTYTFVMAFLSLYSFGYAYELRAENLQEVIFWLRIQYLGISFLPALFLILALQYTGMSRFLKPLLVVPLLLIAFTTLLLQYTNYGNLFYFEQKLNPEVPFILADFVKGPWYWVHQVFANLMLLLSTLLYVLMYRRSAGQGRVRALIMLLALGIPWCFYLFYLIGGSPYNIDLSPFSFSIAGIITAFGIFRYNLLEYVPMALENVFNSMTAGVVILDENNCLVRYNPHAAAILPELSPAMLGKPTDALFCMMPSLATFRDGFESDIEISHQGKVSYYHLQVAAVKTESSSITGWALVFFNISARKTKENELLEIERKLKDLNASKDKFFAIIAHDLRNAFHLIINMADMINENLQREDITAARRKSKIVYETAVTTYSLLQNLLDWALMQLKGIPFNPAELLLADLIQAEISNLKTQSDQKNLTVQSNISETLTIRADEFMIRTVLRNLLSNAVKYSHPGDSITVNTWSDDQTITVEVCDNGIGMDAEEQQKLFNIADYQSKKGTASETGTGLGLKLCKEFIGMHGGTLGVSSESGKGSRFFFTLPVNRPLP